MNKDPVLNKAARLAKSRDYTGALKTLDSEEDRYAGSYKFYYLYAVICLYSGNLGGALAHFRHARDVKMRDPFTMLGLAALYLNRQDTSQAVDYYLDVQELDPGNRIAKKALAVIRKHSDVDSLSAWLAAGKLKILFPPIPSPSFTLRTLVVPMFVLASVSLFAYVLLVGFRVLPNPFRIRSSRPDTEFILSRQERSNPVETGGLYRYILTRDQAVGIYDRALSLFTAYRDEAAKINLNHILESNASEGLKNRAYLLLSELEVPGFDNFKHNDNVSFSDVANEIILYRDVHVIWRGMATNVEILDEHTSFDFLVGYDTRRTLEGIVHVIFNEPVALNSERPLEVLGRIVLTESSLGFMLEGVAIHQSGRLEGN